MENVTLRRMPENRLYAFLAAVSFLIIVLLSLIYFESPAKTDHEWTVQVTSTPTPEPEVQGKMVPGEPEFISVEFVVTRVIDGDTIVIENDERVRYIGIDTPENPTSLSRNECFAREAFEINKELVLGKKVKLEKDVSNRDRYGRLLRYVYIDEIFVNDYLVRSGFATAVTFPPDVKYSEQFRGAENEARLNNRGFWDKCK